MSLDDDPRAILEVARKLSELLSEKLKVHISLAFEGQEPEFSQPQLYYVLGYTTGYSDILAQHAGGEGGGSVSIAVAVKTLQYIFGNEPGQELFHLVERWMSGARRPVEFDDGLTGGAEDATEWINKRQSLGIGRQFMSFFESSDSV